jgi:hypothetical protein
LSSNLLVDVGYVGNRGVWWTAPTLQGRNYNALTLADIQRYGLDMSNVNDRNLLTTQIQNLPRAIGGPQFLARYPYLANLTTVAGGSLVVNGVYPGFPATQPLNQALRPYPQWLGIPPFLGPPLGNTWYDSLQAKLIKRFSRGLTASAAYTFSKELVLGSNGDTSYLTVQAPLINDVFNRNQNKQISSLSHPHALVVNFEYTTPKINSSSAAMKLLSGAVRDWVIGGVLRYQSGDLIRVPASNNGLFVQLTRANNPATFGGATTYFNRVPGQSFFVKDPNCHCINPTDPNGLVLNKNAWQDAPFGQFSDTAAYYDNYRWQRQPSEALSLGRDFHLVGENKVLLNIRAEFNNVFNRLFLSSPTATNPAANTTFAASTGYVTGGFGFVNYINGAGARPRTGQIVARLRF